MENKRKFYAVFVGRKPGVYDSYNKCLDQVYGHTNARYKAFNSLKKAEQAFLRGITQRLYAAKTFKPANPSVCHSRPSMYLPSQDEPISPCICVDGAWNSKTKAFEFQITDGYGLVLRHYGPFLGGTNNIAEFLALVAGIRYCYENLIDYPIYTDSTTALAWLRHKKAKTWRSPDLIPKDVQSALKDAEEWLKIMNIPTKCSSGGLICGVKIKQISAGNSD